MTIIVQNPALFDRLRIQALLRSIADQRGEDQMWQILTDAVRVELRRDIKYQHDDQLRKTAKAQP